MGVTACNDLEGTGDKGYVTQDGLIATVAVDERDPAITYDGEDLDGQALSLADYRGTVVVVSVWGSWCGPCRKEAPWVAGAADELGSDVQFVGINLRDSSTAQAQAFARNFGFGFPSFYSPDGQALLAFRGVLGLRSIPSFVVLDREGRVAASIIGKLPSQQTLVDLTQDVVDEASGGARHG
jgi:thiol-disulfide isomerase/thioredoxin